MNHVIDMMGPFRGCAGIDKGGCDACGYQRLTLCVSTAAVPHAVTSLCEPCIRKAFAEARRCAPQSGMVGTPVVAERLESEILFVAVDDDGADRTVRVTFADGAIMVLRPDGDMAATVKKALQIHGDDVRAGDASGVLDKEGST